MKREVKFVIMLTASDRYRHHHVRIKSTVLSFRVQYETKLDEHWLPVVRYDTRHGFAHRDLLSPSGEVQKTPLFTSDYNAALTFAEQDIKSNWQSYRARFIEKETDRA